MHPIRMRSPKSTALNLTPKLKILNPTFKASAARPAPLRASGPIDQGPMQRDLQRSGSHLMKKKMETHNGLYGDYRVYIGVILGSWKSKWKLLQYSGVGI